VAVDPGGAVVFDQCGWGHSLCRANVAALAMVNEESSALLGIPTIEIQARSMFFVHGVQESGPSGGKERDALVTRVMRMARLNPGSTSLHTFHQHHP
jgi:hypothetical protein